MKTSIISCTSADLAILCSLARETYDETFRPLNTPETMKAYLDAAFQPDKIKRELENPSNRFFLLDLDGEKIGYLKLNDAPAQTDLNDPVSLEIERIYLKKAHQGQGLGGILMGKAVEVAEELGKTYLWLGVWEKNVSAIAFYKKFGFYKSGTHDFVMGDERQRDWIMRKDLA